MKKYSILLALATLSLTSCELLNENPPSSLTVDQVYNTEEGVESVLTGCYQAMAGFNYRACNFYELSVNSVFLASKNASGGIEQALIGDILPNNTTYCDKPFADMWSVISRTNDIMANIQVSPISEEKKQEVVGEARLLRAIALFDLVRTYGRMPLIDKPIMDYTDANAPRESLRANYEFIIADLEYAYQYMPTKGNEKVGRPHAMAAKAYLAKVYLQMASLTKDHFEATKEPEGERYTDAERHEFYTNAYNTALEVKNSGEYQLMPKFADLWNRKNSNTEESIFEMQFGAYGTDSRFTQRTLVGKSSVFAPLVATNSNYGRIRSSKMLFSEHFSRYGNGSAINAIASNSEEGCDPRINVTYCYYNDYREGNDASGKFAIYPNQSSSASVDQAFPYIKKFYYDEFTGIGEINFIVYRYADLLLVLAEAANELDKLSDAVSYVNQVVDRAADANGNGVRDTDELQPMAYSESMGKESVREALRWERVFELVGEGQEMFEVRRHGAEYLKSMITLSDKWVNNIFVSNEEGGLGLTGNLHKVEALYGDMATDDFARQNLFFPYPKSEIQLNDSITLEDQNLGWENY